MDDSTQWVWADGTMSLDVQVFRPNSTIAPNEILIYYMPWDNDYVCNRA